MQTKKNNKKLRTVLSYQIQNHTTSTLTSLLFSLFVLGVSLHSAQSYIPSVFASIILSILSLIFINGVSMLGYTYDYKVGNFDLKMYGVYIFHAMIRLSYACWMMAIVFSGITLNNILWHLNYISNMTAFINYYVILIYFISITVLSFGLVGGKFI